MPSDRVSAALAVNELVTQAKNRELFSADATISTSDDQKYFVKTTSGVDAEINVDVSTKLTASSNIVLPGPNVFTHYLIPSGNIVSDDVDQQSMPFNLVMVGKGALANVVSTINTVSNIFTDNAVFDTTINPSVSAKPVGEPVGFDFKDTSTSTDYHYIAQKYQVPVIHSTLIKVEAGENVYIAHDKPDTINAEFFTLPKDDLAGGKYMYFEPSERRIYPKRSTQ